jgi:predicted alpha/beta superfamily hydrolase
MRRPRTWVLFVVVAAVGPLEAQRDSAIVRVRPQQVRSASLNEVRRFWISLPPGYRHSGRRYPLIVVLDGESNLLPAVAVSRFLSSVNAMPETIVLGVANTNRIRDFTPPVYSDWRSPYLDAGAGGADEFLQFLTDELIPLVERTYRTAPFRVLVGHSLGGLVATYVLARRPRLFNGTILLDPSIYWDRGAVVRLLDSTLGSNPGQRLRLFAGVSGRRSPEARAADEALRAVLAGQPRSSIRWDGDSEPEESHNSIRLPGIYRGLRAIFSDYPPPGPGDAGWTVERVVAHYDSVSKDYGYRVPPPAQFLERWAADLLAEERTRDAVAVLQLAASRYPAAASVRLQLARARQRAGDHAGAATAFREAKALAEAQGNRELVRQAAAGLAGRNGSRAGKGLTRGASR